MKKRWLLPIFASFMLFSDPLTDQVNAATNVDVSNTAYQYLGTPYLYGGTTASGFDCSGFVQKVYADLGISIGRTTYDQFSQGSSVSQGELINGDLVFFNTGGGVSHVGIYIGGGQFIHSASNVGVTVSALSDPYYWASRYVGAKRILSGSSEVIQETTNTNSENENKEVNDTNHTIEESQQLQETQQETVIIEENPQVNQSEEIVDEDEVEEDGESESDSDIQERQIDPSIFNIAYPALEPSISYKTVISTNESFNLKPTLGFRKMFS